MVKLKAHSKSLSFLAPLVALLLIGIGVTGWLIYKHYHRYDLHYTGSSATKVVIVRGNTLNQPGISNFDKTARGTLAFNLINDIDTLKPVPIGPDKIYSCPMDDGVNYSFTFTGPSFAATAPVGGCRWLTINNDKSYFTTDKFWRDVRKATGQPVEPDTIFQ